MLYRKYFAVSYKILSISCLRKIAYVCWKKLQMFFTPLSSYFSIYQCKTEKHYCAHSRSAVLCITAINEWNLNCTRSREHVNIYCRITHLSSFYNKVHFKQHKNMLWSENGNVLHSVWQYYTLQSERQKTNFNITLKMTLAMQ